MQPEQSLRFSSRYTREAGSFKLLELPAELCTLVEGSLASANPLRFSIKGQAGEDAVLCTEDRTYVVRSVTLSNSVLVVTRDAEDDWDDLGGTVVIRDTVNEILELTPTVPKLQKLSSLLQGREYTGDEDDENEAVHDTQKLSFAQAKATIQASDVELALGLKQRHILDIHGQLRPISPEYSQDILQIILNQLVALSMSDYSGVPVERLTSAMADQNEIPRAVSTQIMSWMGDLNDGKWNMDIDALVKEIGLGILRKHRTDPITPDALLESWKSAIGDTFDEKASLSLLAGNYLTKYKDFDLSRPSFTYFPVSELSFEPAARFSDLFLVQSRWKAEDITPFLSGIAVNAKERDKLLLKYARGLTDDRGIWYTARAQYNG